MLIDYVRILEQRQRTVYYSMQKQEPEFQHFLCQFLKPYFTQIDTKRARQYLYSQWVVLKKRNPELRKLEFFIMNRKNSCPLLQRETLYLGIDYRGKTKNKTKKHQLVTCSRGVQKHGRPVENCLPTSIFFLLHRVPSS